MNLARNMPRGIAGASLGLAAALLPLLVHGQGRAPTAEPGVPRAPSLSLLEKGARIEQVVAGLQYVEAATGDGKGNVFFADLPTGRILRWSASGRLSIIRDGAATPMGIGVAPSGQLIICEAKGRKLTVTDADGYARTLIDAYQGKKLNSPCGVWVDASGGVYFSDPRLDHGEQFEQDRERLYYLRPDATEPTPAAEDLRRPEALAAAPDGRTLYVADVLDNKTWAYAIGANGSLSGKRLLAPTGTRGLTVDERGNVYLISGAVRVYSPGGDFLGEFRGPGPAYSGAFGGEDGRILYLACNIQKPVPGAPPGKVESQGGLYAVRMTVRGRPPTAQTTEPAPR